jgi:hypothetical protein
MIDFSVLEKKYPDCTFAAIYHPWNFTLEAGAVWPKDNPKKYISRNFPDDKDLIINTLDELLEKAEKRTKQ